MTHRVPIVDDTAPTRRIVMQAGRVARDPLAAAEESAPVDAPGADDLVLRDAWDREPTREEIGPFLR